MFGKEDLEKRIEEVIEKYPDRDTYMEWKRRYNKYYAHPAEARTLQNNWLWDKGGMQYDPADRVMVVMPLVLYQVELGCLSEEMEDELYGTKEDLEDGLLDDLDELEIELLKADLDYCFKKLKEEGKLNG